MKLRSKMSIITSSALTNATSTSSSSEKGVAKSAKMYNLNVNLNAVSGNTLINNLLAVDPGSATPRTPEILNSVIAMTNPLDDYSYNNGIDKSSARAPRSGSGNDSNSNSSGSPLGSPVMSSTPSVQKTRSQLIKAGLKLSIESKRKMSGSDSADGSVCNKRFKKEEASDDEGTDDHYSNLKTDGLTPEDEERRRRRRERNKIAATKCRLKKRERTVNLVNESEVLETQNIDLKSQIQELEVQRRHLVDMLSHHSPTCLKNNANTSSPTNPYNPIQPPYDSPTGYQNSSAQNSPYEQNSPYIRPESANLLPSSYNYDIEPPSNFNQPVDPLDIGTPYSSIGTPSTESNCIKQEDVNFMTSDTFSKNSNVLLIENSQNEYSDQILSFDNQDTNSYQYNNRTSGISVQQCHNVNSGGTHQNKFRDTGIDNGCMA